MSQGEGRGGRDSGGEGGEDEEEEKKEKEEKEEEGEEEEDSDDEEEDSEEEEEVGIALQLPQRATRGLAYQRLIGEALEEDQAFWNHKTWADEEEDADYNCSEGEEVYADVIDSDFDRPEDEDEEDSTSDGGGGEGEGEGRHRGGEGGETSMTKQRDSRHRREKKRKKGRRGRDSDEEDEDAGERKKTRKEGFELMWKRRQAKLEREERQRRERKTAQAKGQLQKEEGGRNRRPQARGEEDRRETHRGKREGGTSQGKQEDKAGGFFGVETRQLRVTRGRRFRAGDGSSSTSDEHENNGTSSRQKRQKRQQKKPLETRPRGGATAREVTLEEHLEEARRTEEKNLAVLLAMEERDEARRLRHVFDLKKNVYAGDYDRYFSWASWLVVGEEAAEDAAPFPAAETAAADTTQRQQMQQEVETQQEQHEGALPQQWKTDVDTATVSRDSKVETAECQKKRKEGREEEAARAATTQRDVPETGGTKEGPHALLHSVKEESAAMAGADGKCRRAAEEAAAAPAESAAAGRDGIETSSASGATGEGQEPKKTWSRLSACGTPEKKEKNEMTRKEKRSTASSGLSETGSRPVSPRRQQEQQQLPQQWLPEQHLLMQQGRQPQQQRQTNDGKLDQPYMRLEQKSTQQRWAEAVEATGGEKGTRVLGDEEDGEDGTREEPRESEGYAMELRMFTDGKIPDMYTQQPIGAPTPHLRCIITGQRAKYRDPLTGAPYATLHAFKCLRNTFQHLREQRLLQVMQEIKDVLGTAQSADVFGFESPSAASTSRAPAGAGGNRYASLSSGLPLHSGITSGTSGSTGGYASIIGKDVAAATNNQMRQRRAAAGGGQALLVKKREFPSLTKKPLTSTNFAQDSDSCNETVAFRTAPMPVEGWPVCREAEQKRRRNGRNAVSCGKKAACSRTTKKL